MKLPKVNVTKHTVIVVACLALVFTAGVATHKAWVHHVARQQAITAHNEAVAKQKADAEATAVIERNKALKTECTKEVSYWDALTPLQKKTKPAPNCQGLAQ